jgi:tight adherence protein C
MVWVIASATFLATLIIFVSIYYAFSSGETAVVRRLSRLSREPDAPPRRERAFGQKQRERIGETLASVGRLFPGKTNSRAQLMLTRAGYRSPTIVNTMRGIKILLPVLLVAAVYSSGLYLTSPFMILGGALLAGIAIPESWILWRVSARQNRLRHALPDAIDLLVICVEVGLGLDQALLRVAQELRVVHPELSEELRVVNLEMRVGKTRLEALRELSRRTGLEDAKSLVAMLAQTERFGTSIAQSLRVYSDELRTKRRQRAEEMSAKTTVKMVPPLVLFVFPALMVVILGPAVLILVREFVHVFK